VLVVDDEELTLRSLARAIRRIGRATTVSSGRAAVELLDRDDGFDAIVTDLVMVDGSGHDLIEWIRSHRPQLLERVIVMTGMTHPDLDAPDSVPRMLKPFDLDELRRTIETVAKRRVPGQPTAAIRPI
jgi:DNA-binding NtrC family response regulator